MTQSRQTTQLSFPCSGSIMIQHPSALARSVLVSGLAFSHSQYLHPSHQLSTAVWMSLGNWERIYLALGSTTDSWSSTCTDAVCPKLYHQPHFHHFYICYRVKYILQNRNPKVLMYSNFHCNLKLLPIHLIPSTQGLTIDSPQQGLGWNSSMLHSFR